MSYQFAGAAALRVLDAGAMRMAELDRLIIEERAAIRQRGRELNQLAPRLVERYCAGENITTLASELGVHPRAVLYRLQISSVETRRQRVQRIMQAEAERIVQLYASGLTSLQVGELVGISDNSVRTVLRRMKAGPRGFGPPPAKCCKLCGKRKVRGRRLCRTHVRAMKAQATHNWYRKKQQQQECSK